MTLRIEAMTAVDWPRVREIYQQGLDTGEATLETAAPEWAEWDGDHLPQLPAGGQVR